MRKGESVRPGTAEQLVEMLRRSAHAVILTGAGASTESGLPDFRSSSGLWQGVDPLEVASIQALRRDPARFYEFYKGRLAKLGEAKPNPVHAVLASLEGEGFVKAVITQNVDGLHQAAGSRRVIEVHGNLCEATCTRCRGRHPIKFLADQLETPGALPRCPDCLGLLRPAVVLFGEPLPSEAFADAVAETRRADFFLVVGSSLQVAPVNMLPSLALEHGASLAIINLEATPFDYAASAVLRDVAGEVLAKVAAGLGVAWHVE